MPTLHFKKRGFHDFYNDFVQYFSPSFPRDIMKLVYGLVLSLVALSHGKYYQDSDMSRDKTNVTVFSFGKKLQKAQILTNVIVLSQLFNFLPFLHLPCSFDNKIDFDISFAACNLGSNIRKIEMTCSLSYFYKLPGKNMSSAFQSMYRKIIQCLELKRKKIFSLYFLFF